MGAPYVPTRRRDVAAHLDLAGLEPGQTLIDLGSGDGRLLAAAAHRGLRAIGFELNPWLWAVATIRCWPHRRIVKVHLGNFWRVNLPPADAVYVFLIRHHMAKLDRKLRAELTRPTTVVSYTFPIPGRAPVTYAKNCYVYRYPN
jgi:hypothetical protein